MKREGGRPLTTSRPDPDLLGQFAELLRNKAVPLGFIARSDAGRIVERHINDSLRAVRCLRSTDRDLIDLGAGAGLPGIPVAIAEPERRVVLIEAMAKRAAFLELAVQHLGLANVDVRVARVEDVDVLGDTCFARALAPPHEAWHLAERVLRPRGQLVYFAGRSWSAAISTDLRAAGARTEVCDRPQFAWQGPIVIMARTSQ